MRLHPTHSFLFPSFRKLVSAILGRFLTWLAAGTHSSLPRAPSYPVPAHWSEPRYVPRAGFLWAALLSEEDYTKFAHRQGGGYRGGVIIQPEPSTALHHPAPPPSSIPAILLFQSHSFLPFLYISASILHPPPPPNPTLPLS